VSPRIKKRHGLEYQKRTRRDGADDAQRAPGEVRAKVFGYQPRSRNQEWLLKRIAWGLQANQEGDLSERARRRAEELANDADLRLTAPRLPRRSPAEQARILNLLVERIDYDGPAGNVSITFRPTGIKALATQLGVCS
jgi:hypothetical protein